MGRLAETPGSDARAVRPPAAGESPPSTDREPPDFRSMADAAPAILWVTDPTGACTFLSRGWYELTGQTEREALGMGWVAAVHPDDRQQSSQAFLAANANRESFRLDYRLRNRYGDYRWAIDAGRPWLASGGEFLGYVGSVIDITDRKQAELALREREDQLRQAQKIEAIGRLAAGVAHDFNNLLTVINGHIELLRERIGGGEARDEIDEIAWAVARGRELTGQLLAFGRNQVLTVTAVDLNAFVDEMYALLGRLLGKAIAVVADTDPRAGAVYVDRGQLTQVMLNVAVNARDAMPDGGTLTIRTRRADAGDLASRSGLKPGAYAMLALSDTGTGMTAAVQAQAFDPFFTTKDLGKGTGLGLSSVYGIVKQSGGDVEIESRVGHGTTITIYLPQVDATAAQPPIEAAQPLRGAQMILLVEDERAVRQLAVRFLQAAGYHVTEASNADDAIRHLSSSDRQIDLLMTDIDLAGTSGLDLAERARDMRPTLPILYFTGYPRGHALRASDSERSRVVHKPFSRSQLLATVRQAIGAAAGRS